MSNIQGRQPLVPAASGPLCMEACPALWAPTPLKAADVQGKSGVSHAGRGCPWPEGETHESH